MRWLLTPLVIASADQLAKWLARRTRAAAAHGWRLDPAPRFAALGCNRLIVLWLALLPVVGVVAIAARPPEWAGLAGVSAWAAAGSNLFDFVRLGGVIDHLKVLPDTLGNLADVVLVLGTSVLLVGFAV